MPAWVLRRTEQVDNGALGGQVEWHFATPWLFRALASPTTGEPVLAAPGPDDPHEQRRAYWAGILYLLLFRLGWSDPARGLDWWQGQGFPDSDPQDRTLRLIKKVWVNDGRIDLLRAWLQLQQRPFMPEMTALPGYRQKDIDDEPRSAHIAADTSIYENVLGPAQLHLEHGGYHLTAPLEAGDGLLLRTNRSQRRAVLTVDSLTGWYSALAAHGSELPDLGLTSWHIDVFARPVGHLGTYRRSRQTGLWFTGKHSVHAAGN